VFNLGMGEITVLLLLGLIFFGPSTLPELLARLREGRRPSDADRPSETRRPWSRSDWQLLAAAVALAGLWLGLRIASQ
jgi:hypothetical protein